MWSMCEIENEWDETKQKQNQKKKVASVTLK